MKEEWKPVKGYEGLYEVSNMGRVKSLNYRHTGKEKILEGYDNSHGYLYANLYKDGKRKQCRINRLVAQAFISNPDNLPCINHKDENKYNNCMDNLEWCSHSYNLTYNGRAKKVGKKLAEKLSKPVFSVDKETGLIMYWESTREAERCTGIPHQNIIQCCQDKRKSAGNHIWFYADDNDNE